MAKNKPKKNTFNQSSSSGNKNTGGKGSDTFAFFGSRQFKTSFGLFLLLFSILLGIAFISYLTTWKDDDLIFQGGFWAAIMNGETSSANVSGKIGGWLSYVFIKRWFGLASFLFIPVFVLWALRLLEINFKRFGFTILMLLSFIIYFSLLLSSVFTAGEFSIYGGIIGTQISQLIKSVAGNIGLVLFLIFGAALLISITLPKLYYDILERVKKIELKRKKSEIIENEITENELLSTELQPEEKAAGLEFTTHLDEKPLQEEHIENEQPIQEVIEAIQTEGVPFEIINSNQHNQEKEVADTEETNDESIEYGSLDSLFDPRKELESYIFPDVNLLEDYGTGIINIDKQELEANKIKIETTLQNYGISIDRIFATVGPTVTLYEIVPAAGIRISKIKNLEDDIALSLSALGIRIIAPIPGKGTIGIEVPNRNPEIVSFKSLVVSSEFQNTSFDLPIALGKTIDNKPYIADLTKMPHLLMAGATGQGKSVGLNTIIASLLFKKHPAELKFVLVDPKKVELPLYSKIERHYLAKLPDSDDAIITDTSLVVKTLKGLTTEMDQRYDLLKDAKVRNIKEYNEKFTGRRLNPNNGHKFLPYIVLVVDEFADLIMTAGKEVEGPIARIAQLARAVGIHLIIATQRPSVNIITGIIKANFPARMAFKVSAKVDSRTILDQSGADQLIGRGDMLLSNGSRIDRLQCAFIDTPELEKITEFIGSQRGYPSAFELPEVITEEDDTKKDFDPNDKDPLFAEAARIIVQSQHGSTSLLQRKLKLGYNRAGRLIDQLESAGVVGPFEGSKAREVLIKDLEYLEQLLNNYNTN